MRTVLILVPAYGEAPYSNPLIVNHYDAAVVKEFLEVRDMVNKNLNLR